VTIFAISLICFAGIDTFSSHLYDTLCGDKKATSGCVQLIGTMRGESGISPTENALARCR
jgi:hypothetical protein